MKRIIIDTDPGIDDAAAILMALASPELQVVAVTTIFGNASVGRCTINAHHVLSAAGCRHIPVVMGARKPLLRPANAGWTSHIHGEDGLGGATVGRSLDALPAAMSTMTPLYAVQAIVDTFMYASPGDEITILALGRMTNIALALSIEPKIAEWVQEIVVMGGAVTVPGNVSGVATANLHEDPESAAIVYRSGAPIVQVGLDVCNRVTVSPAQLEAIAGAGSPATRLLSEATGYLRQAYIRTGRIGPEDGVRYNDMPAIGYAIDPSLFTARDAFVEIETHSELTKGQTVAVWNSPEPNARICLEVDAEALTAMFTDRLCASIDVH